MGTLAVEFTTSRMLQTVYGTSNIVWANVIGLVLFFLTIGYFLGGRLADRYPSPRLFYALRHRRRAEQRVLPAADQRHPAQRRHRAGRAQRRRHRQLAGRRHSRPGRCRSRCSAASRRSPSAWACATSKEAGRISGRIYAVSTWGSLLGTYLPVLFVIPAGRHPADGGDLWRCAASWSGWSGSGAATVARRRRRRRCRCCSCRRCLLWLQGGIKDYPGQIFETESAYNYIQVVREDDCNYLLLNEGQAYHSFYCDGGAVPRVSVWSIMLAAPYFHAPGGDLRRAGSPSSAWQRAPFPSR